MTFELALYAFNSLLGDVSNAIVLVVVLLISLMKDQVSSLNAHGILVSYIGEDCLEQQLEEILDLKAKLVFGSPEAILNNYQHKLCPLKIDTSHFWRETKMKTLQARQVDLS